MDGPTGFAESVTTFKITYVATDGGGFVGEVDVAPGTTIGQFFYNRLGSTANPTHYTIRVNRVDEQVAGSRVLVAGDKVFITPRNIKGAGR